MSNQKLQNQSEKKEDESGGVNKRRRFIKGASVAAPVVLTLASGSVFGAQCLSSRMSGNLSQHAPNDDCWGGQTPGFWKEFYSENNGNNGNNVGLNQGKSCPFNHSKTECWNAAGFTYGSYGNGTNNLQSGTGHDGTKLSATILAAVSDDPRTLSQILLQENGSNIWHLVAAMLNSYYCQNNGSGQHYIITPTQFVGLLNGSISIPGNDDAVSFIRAFVEASYHDLANDPGICGLAK